MAADQGNDAIVKLLLDQDSIDINQVSSDGETPLDHAIRRRHECAVELLRKAGGRMGVELRAESTDADRKAGREQGRRRG
ncbi:hypothetical protein BD779DRAFT_1526507 [Infundibulicybe gibba]|nr:hypothetical protein BD779DRAFT_1526507 [Infundibulicybe gibba]